MLDSGGAWVYTALMSYPPKPDRNKLVIEKVDAGESLRSIAEEFNLKSHKSIIDIYRRWAPLYSKKHKKAKRIP
jgi:hypothetical protein